VPVAELGARLAELRSQPPFPRSIDRAAVLLKEEIEQGDRPRAVSLGDDLPASKCENLVDLVV
jgi:hypothetical protein